MLHPMLQFRASAIGHAATSAITTRRNALDAAAATIPPAINARLHIADSLLKSKATLLDALSPEKVLARGYSLTYGADGHILTEADAVAVGDIITTRLAGGSIIQSQVTSKDNPNG